MSDSSELEEGGESACWLDRVCPECGRLADRPVTDRCRACEAGAEAEPPATEAAPATRPDA